MQNKVIALGAILALTGCPSVSTMGTARTLDSGKAQFWIAPGFANGTVVGTNTVADNEGISVPGVELGGRYGVSDSIDIGGKLGFTSGPSIDAKFQLVKSATTDSGIDLSINPGLGYGLGVFASLPVLIGINFGGNQLVLGPKLIDQYYGYSAGDTSTYLNVLYGGGSVGVSLKLGESFRILPELSVMYPMVTSAGASAAGESASDSTKGVGLMIIQGGVGFMFGG